MHLIDGRGFTLIGEIPCDRLKTSIGVASPWMVPHSDVRSPRKLMPVLVRDRHLVRLCRTAGRSHSVDLALKTPSVTERAVKPFDILSDAAVGDDSLAEIIGLAASIGANTECVGDCRVRPQSSIVFRVLFICSRNRWRSPTAEHVFSGRPGVECASAGLTHDAENPVTPELLLWADLILVMERGHKTKLQSRLKSLVSGKRIVCLGIPDKFTYMEPRLVQLLEVKVNPLLPA